MKLEIITGDITKTRCDAIVCPVNPNLEWTGESGYAIRKAIGSAYLKPSQGLEVGRCIVTSGYHLPCKSIIHTVVPHARPYPVSSFHNADTVYTPSRLSFSKCYKNAIERALSEKYRTIAFPLLGTWDYDIPEDAALDIASSAIQELINENNRDIKVMLVLTDEQKLALEAKENSGKHVAVSNEELIEEVLPLDKRWISLCKVNKPDRNRDTWLLRLADAVEGSLAAPAFDENKEQIFDNRRLIFREDGPGSPDYIGFWEWKERKSASGRWWSDSTYMEETKPIEIVVLDKCSSVEQIADTLKTGLHIPAYLSGSILFAVRKYSSFVGLLCELSDFNVRPGKYPWAILKDSVHMLSYYELNDTDIFTWSDRKIYRHISLAEPKKRFPIHIPIQMIKQLFLQRMTWPAFKTQGITKGDWQKIKQFFSEIPDQTILETLSQTYGMSPQEAQDCVDAFLQTIEAHIDVEDMDSSLIAQMLDHHEGLKQKTEAVAQEKWQEDHQAEVEQARAEIADMRNAAEQEVAAAKQQLADIEKSVADANAKHSGIQEEITVSQGKLDQLLADIEQYETLGNDAMEAVRKKIADAQKDMAGFIADLSVVLPQTQTKPSGLSITPWKYETAPEADLDDEELDVSETWKEEYAQICGNISGAFGVNNELCEMFGAFLYATYIHNEPVLVAGPGGRELANVLSKSIFATDSGHVVLGNEYDVDILDGVQKHGEPIVAIHNMFNKGWADTLPQTFSNSGKHIIWSAPYAEDIIIEPKGLFNYALPLLSECFIENMPKNDAEPENRVWAAQRSTKFKAYAPGKKLPLRLASWKRLKLSKLLMNRMECILSDVKRLVERESSYKDIEVLLGLLPLAVLTGKTDILGDLLESEKGLSSAVRAEVLRYIEEE